MQLFHFSDDPSIATFQPRPVRIASERGPARDWLNGPLVWAIDDWHQPLYLFPRDCPRILMWATPGTTAADRAAFWGKSRARMLAYVETGWLGRISAARLWRYELPPATFENLDDAGMWVSRRPVVPLRMDEIGDLLAALAQAGVEIRDAHDLTFLRGAWSRSLHVSGLRLRNALGWSAAEAEKT